MNFYSTFFFSRCGYMCGYTGKPTKAFFLPDPCNTRKVMQTRKVKLLLSRFFFLVIFKQRINDYA